VTAHPGDGDILSALVNFVRARGDSALANRYANRLRLITGNR